MSISAAFSISANGLRAYQTQMDTISNNISNANTPGYHEETAVLTALPGTNLGRASPGGGVMVSAINRNVDMALQAQLFSAASTKSQTNARSQALSDISTSLSDSSSQFSTALNDFAGSLSKLSQQPSSVAARQQVLSTAQTLASSADAIQSNLTNAITGYDQKIRADVDTVNQLSKSLADINRSMTFVGKDQAGALQDQALQTAQQLAEKTGGSMRVEDNGMVDVYMPSGKTLAMGTSAYPMALSDAPDVQGEIGGLEKAKADTQGYQGTFTSALQSLSSQFNAVHQAGTDVNGQPGQAFFAVDTSGNLQVAISDPNLVAAGTGGGADDGSNLKALSQVSNSVGPNSTSMSAMFNVLVTKAGGDSQNASSDAQVAVSTYTVLDEREKATEGVDTDAQAVAMTQAQRCYQACAQVLSTENQMIGSLLQAVGG